MPTSRNRSSKPQSDTTPETDAPTETEETPVSPETAEAPQSDEVPTTDSESETDTPDIPALPDDFTPEHPLVAELLEMVKSAEEHKDDPTPIADFVANADRLFATDTGFALVEATTKVEGGLEFAVDAFDRMRLLADFLRPSVETVDRDAGDDLVKALVALAKVPRGISSETDKQAIDVLSARWWASAPKRTPRSGSGTPRARGESDIPVLKFPDGKDLRVRFKCGLCGKTFSTRKDNLNSARREIIKHMVRSHHKRAETYAEGTPAYKALTEGFFVTGLSNGSEKPKADILVDSIKRGENGAEWTFIREAA